MLKLIYKIAFASIFAFSTNISAQLYTGVYDELYKEMYNNARSSALGQVGSVFYGSPFYTRFNPAASSFGSGINIEYSKIKPDQSSLYGYGRAERYGIAANAKLYGAVSFAYNHYVQGYEEYYELHGENYEIVHPVVDNYMLNYSYNVMEGLGVGFNINYQSAKNVGVKKDAVLFDIGVLKKITISEDESNQNLFVGLSLSNIFNKEEVEKNIIKDREGRVIEFIIYKAVFPSDLRIGASYETETKTKAMGFKIFKYMLAAEYEDPVNSALFSAYKFGMEFTFLEMLQLRIGFYNEKISDSDYGNSNSKNTYGAGLCIPLAKIMNANLPVVIKIDYANMSAPRYSSSARFYILDAGLNIEL